MSEQEKQEETKQEETKQEETKQEDSKLAEMKVMTEQIVNALTKPLETQTEKITSLVDRVQEEKQQKETGQQDAAKFNEWKKWHETDPAGATAALVASVGKQVIEKAQEAAKNTWAEQQKIQQDHNNTVRMFLTAHPDVSWQEMQVKLQELIDEKGPQANSPLLLDLARERLLREKGEKEPPYSEKGKSGKTALTKEEDTNQDIFAGALKLKSPMDI